MYTYIFRPEENCYMWDELFSTDCTSYLAYVLTQREVVLFVGKDIGKDTCMYAKHSRMHGLDYYSLLHDVHEILLTT